LENKFAMNVIFFKSKTFLAREVENALKKRGDINLVVAALPERIPPHVAQSVFEQLKNRLPALIISINDAGSDLQGNLSDLLSASGSLLCNWYLDDPFYEEIFYNRKTVAAKNRIDFVSEASFVTTLQERGRNVFFLPLAVDPLYFNRDKPVEIKRDVAFVGNSSLEWLDTVIKEDALGQLEKFAPLMATLKKMYYQSPATADLRSYLVDNSTLWENAIALDREKFLFLTQWMVGYLYRKDLIVAIAGAFQSRFTCFGDIYWSTIINPALVSTDACYYTNLGDYYRSTKVNLNINRIQIKTSFTQRIFDCKAAGAFVLTEKRALNSRYFITEGPQQELVEFSSWPECIRLIDYFCAHEDERQEIALAGRDKVLQFHTYDKRIQQMFETCKKVWGI
jgi:spore maturation protein CgeB